MPVPTETIDWGQLSHKIHGSGFLALRVLKSLLLNQYVYNKRGSFVIGVRQSTYHVKDIVLASQKLK